MLAWELVVEAQALRSQGWTVSAIARHLGVTRVGWGWGKTAYRSGNSTQSHARRPRRTTWSPTDADPRPAATGCSITARSTVAPCLQSHSAATCIRCRPVTRAGVCWCVTVWCWPGTLQVSFGPIARHYVNTAAHPRCRHWPRPTASAVRSTASRVSRWWPTSPATPRPPDRCGQPTTVRRIARRIGDRDVPPPPVRWR
jgi:hypothetical protein